MLQEKYQRTLADRENVRNRLEKQITEAKQFGIQGFCKDLLEVRMFVYGDLTTKCSIICINSTMNLIDKYFFNIL